MKCSVNIQAMVCMFRNGNALEDFYQVEKWPCLVLVLQLLGACCRTLMEIPLHSHRSWVCCWGFGLSCFLKLQLCGVGKTAGRICAVGVSSGCCRSGAEDLSRGTGLDQQRAGVSALGLSWHQTCRFPSHREVRFVYPLNVNVTNPKALDSNDEIVGKEAG